MNRRNKLESATAEELVEYFVETAMVQDKAMRQGDTPKYNRLYREMDAVEQELRTAHWRSKTCTHSTVCASERAGQAASSIATLALAPNAARQVLQIISDREEYPQAVDA